MSINRGFRGARDVVLWLVPLAALIIAVFVFNMPLWFAVPFALVLFGALYFLLNPRTGGQESQDDVRLETEQVLREARDQVSHIRALAPGVPKQTVRDQILVICAMADEVLSKLLATPGASLLTASRLKGVFSQAYEILAFYSELVNGKVTTTPEKRKQLVDQIENNVLSQLQSSLHDFAAQVDQGEVASLEATIKVLEGTLKLEGLA